MRQIIRGIRNLIAFVPLIWRDRDWDYCFLLEMLVFKLRRMEAAFVSDAAVSLDSEKAAASIKFCHETLARAWEDDYRADELAAHEGKWGRSCCPKCGGLFCECFPVYGKESGDIVAYSHVTEYPKANGEEEEKQARNERIAIYLRQDDDKKTDLRDAFGLMGERILWWWD